MSKHYRRELRLGMSEANTNVAKNLYGIAIGKSPQAASAGMFWLKTRAGWRETGPPEDAPERPPTININFVGPSKKTIDLRANDPRHAARARGRHPAGI